MMRHWLRMKNLFTLCPGPLLMNTVAAAKAGPLLVCNRVWTYGPAAHWGSAARMGETAGSQPSENMQIGKPGSVLCAGLVSNLFNMLSMSNGRGAWCQTGGKGNCIPLTRPLWLPIKLWIEDVVLFTIQTIRCTYPTGNPFLESFVVESVS